jgi:hypothetical protein
VRGQWIYVDFVRAFLPRWLADATSLKVFSLVVLALLVLVVFLKLGTSIA